MMISLTRELTIVVNAPPTTTPTARSITLPRLMNSLNSSINFLFDLIRFLLVDLSFSLSIISSL